MNNNCLIIMPPADLAGYPNGHIGRVYDYIVVPACRKAGYFPARIDAAVYSDSFDIVKQLVDSDIVICDISGNNSNALYALAVRHVFDLPVVVIKDAKSSVMFDAHQLGVVSYDESLRIDTVQGEVEALTEALNKAVDSRKDRHEFLYRLGIGRPSVPTPDTASSGISQADETPSHEEEAPKEKRLPFISPIPSYVRDPFTEEQIGNLKIGDDIFHMIHGRGKLSSLKKMGKDKLAGIQFDSGSKFLVLTNSELFRAVQD